MTHKMRCAGKGMTKLLNFRNDQISGNGFLREFILSDSFGHLVNLEIWSDSRPLKEAN
jgi:hypothetical protein